MGLEWAQMFERVRDIPTDDYPGGRWPAIRYDKMKAFFSLARETTGGCIVELGTWRGLGATVLALGAPPGVAVYTIDDYATRCDHLGYRYGPHDALCALRAWNDKNVAVLPVLGDVRKIAETWTEPIGLLVWDLGEDRLERDFQDWAPRVIPGGLFAAKDLESGGFGAKRLGQQPGWQMDRIYTRGCVFVVRKAGPW